MPERVVVEEEDARPDVSSDGEERRHSSVGSQVDAKNIDMLKKLVRRWVRKMMARRTTRRC